MLTIRAMSGGKGYASRHLENRDYYAEGERVIGHWQGHAAEMLGLRGEVRAEDFERLAQGLDPHTGEFLRPRHSVDRIAADGSAQSHGRDLYDFTFSAPKSVSVMAILGNDDRLIRAHEQAVEEALKELESCAATRVRKDGANVDRPTGNLAIAVYHHDSSRELDPQIHTHAVAANLTHDGTEGRWKALQASGIYERRSYLTEVYRNSLAREIRNLGYEIESRRDARGRDRGFEISGVSGELIDRFSQRSHQRDEAIERFTAEKGRLPTDNEVSVLVRETRADKLIEISTSEVRKRQRERLSLKETWDLSELKPEEPGKSIRFSPTDSLEYAKGHVFERVSVVRDHEVLTEALRHGRGRISLDELKGSLMREESAGKVFRHGGEIATAGSLKREREMVDAVNRGIGKFEPLGKDRQFVASDRLNPEQKSAVEAVLNSRDRAVNIRGAAGTGKTATLQEFNRGLSEAGRKVLAIAPTASAVEELRKVGFVDAITVERLLQDPAIHSSIHGHVVIADEAGMLSGRQMSELLRISEQHSARIVFSGDTRQIQSVEAGDALRILEKESRLHSVSLTQVRRQTEAGYREAVQELRRDPERGFDRLEEIGAVREVPWQDRARETARAYSELSEKGSALVVCATHDEIASVTDAIRASRKETGEIGVGVQLTRDVSLNWTTAQKGDFRNLQPGQVLTFHSAADGISKNDSVEVLSVGDGAATVRDSRGHTKEIKAKDARSFEVCERRQIEVAAGDRLLLTANRRQKGFRATNGEIVTVKSIDRQGRISLRDGRVLPENYRQFTHGYAVTAHRSQGKSVDSVIISAEGMRKEQFYVAASRGRERALVITSDKEGLRQSVSKSTARQSASELERKSRPSPTQGLRFGLQAARQLARRAAERICARFRHGPERNIRLENRPIPERRTQQPTKPISREEPEHDYSISR
jgi:conjugative relaxase-like TrwC/TraI family protein